MKKKNVARIVIDISYNDFEPRYDVSRININGLEFNKGKIFDFTKLLTVTVDNYINNWDNWT